MKNLLALISLVLFSGSLYAQFGTFSRSDYAQVGDTQLYAVCDTNGITAGSGGAGQTWDYSTATKLSSVTVRIETPSVANQGNNFPTATQGWITSLGDYKFYKVTTDSLILVGEKSVANTPAFYTDPAFQFSFPISLNDMNIDTALGEFPDGFFSNVSRTGTFISSYDGEGTLITPRATYTNCARLVTQVIYDDSSWTGLADGEIIAEFYEWYQKGRRLPVMRFSRTEISINQGAPQFGKEVWYADSLLTNAISPQAETGALDVYPNPASMNSTVRLNLHKPADVKAVVFNLAGQQVAVLSEGRLNAGEHKWDLKTTSLPSGTYLVRVNLNGKSLTQRVIVE